MKNADKAFVQAYYAPLAVDASPQQLIVGCAVTNQGADAPYPEPMVEQVQEMTGATSKEWGAAAGYFSAHNLDVLSAADVESHRRPRVTGQAIPPDCCLHPTSDRLLAATSVAGAPRTAIDHRTRLQ